MFTLSHWIKISMVWVLASNLILSGDENANTEEEPQEEKEEKASWNVE
jgi:hypothetical protein